MPERRTLTEAERQASSWIVRLKAHDVTDTDRKAFEAWRTADPAHAQAYAKLERTWAVVASLDHLKGRSDTTARPRRPSLMLAAAIAASALLAIGALAWFTRPAEPAAGQHYVTQPAEIRTITLADGSTMTLSAAAEASVSFSEHERRIELGAGYALFDAEHDAARPFIVHTPQGDIRVLGTSFVVRVGEDQVRTTVIRGSVSGEAERSGFLGVLGAVDHVTAEANEEIILSEAGASVVLIAAEVIPRRLAWRDGMLAFDGETLSEAIAEVSGQTGWQFKLADPSLGEMRVGGYVAADPEAFIGLVSSSLGLEARREGDRRIVLSRRS